MLLKQKKNPFRIETDFFNMFPILDELRKMGADIKQAKREKIWLFSNTQTSPVVGLIVMICVEPQV